VVLDGNVSPTLLLLSGLERQLLRHSFFRNELISWLADYVLRLQHVVDSRFRSDQASDLALRELEV
jgi:hypothetical protein